MKLLQNNLVLLKVSQENSIVLLDENLAVVHELEGIKGPKKDFTINESKCYSNRPGDIWLKGNHQASLIGVEEQQIQEKSICSLFGSSDDYDSNLALKVLYTNKASHGGKWVGEFYKNQRYFLSYKDPQTDTVQFSELKSIIPEGE